MPTARWRTTARELPHHGQRPPVDSDLVAVNVMLPNSDLFTVNDHFDIHLFCAVTNRRSKRRMFEHDVVCFSRRFSVLSVNVLMLLRRATISRYSYTRKHLTYLDSNILYSSVGHLLRCICRFLRRIPLAPINSRSFLPFLRLLPTRGGGLQSHFRFFRS